MNRIEPSGARTTPPWMILGPDNVTAPKAEYGMSGMPSVARRIVSTASGFFTALPPPCP